MSDSQDITEQPAASPPGSGPQAVYGDSDINAQVILWVAGGLFTFVLVTYVVVGGLFHYFGDREARLNRDALPMASQDAARPAEERIKAVPQPRLEGIEPATVAERRAADAARLERYGWVDEKQGIVHVPIDVAMKVLLEKKLLPAADKGKAAAGEKR
jgi:hypothetical protein